MRIIFLLFACIASLLCKGQISLYSYGEEGFETGSEIKTLSNGDAIICGVHSLNSGPAHPYLLRVNPQGDELWTVHYDSLFTNDIRVDELELTADGDFLIVASSVFPGGSNMELIKVDENGEIIWHKTYDYGNTSISLDVLELDNNELIVLGLVSYSAEDERLVLMRTSETGDTLWTTEFSYPGYNFGFGFLVQGRNSTVAIASHRFQAGVDFSTDSDPVLISASINDGSMLWDYVYPSILDERIYNMSTCPDGGFILVGEETLHWPPSVPSNVFLLKTDSMGTLQWSQGYGGSNIERGADVLAVNDGDFYVCGDLIADGSTTHDVLLMHLDDNGSWLWSQTADFNYSDHTWSMDYDADTTFIYMSGTIAGVDGSEWQTLFAVFDISSVGLNSYDLAEIAIYPNPAAEYVFVRLEADYTDLKLYSLSGELVYATEARDGGRYNLPSVPIGIYMMVLEENGVLVGARQVIIDGSLR